MWRELPTSSFGACRTLRPTANRSFFTSSIKRSSALSRTAAMSPSGTRCRSRSCACRSLSRNARLAVNWTLKVSSVSGASTARRARAAPGGGPAIGDGSPAARSADRTVAGAGSSGSLRISAGMAGCGERRATSSSTPRFDLPAACARTSRWFWSVRCGTSMRSPVRCTCPERTASTMAGNRRAARATVIRAYAASSENPSSSTQNANIEGNAHSR